MGEKKSGFYWHVHHDCLLEYCYDYDKRLRYILKDKPEHERRLRLRLFRPIKGELPARVIEAGAAYGKARAAYGKARAAYGKAGAAYGKAGAAYDEAGAAYDEAGAAYDEAGAAYDEAVRICNDEILTLHAKECPDCPWDGETIFYKANE